MRVLEVGIGSEWRVGRRGLYQSGLRDLLSKDVSSVEITGIDVSIPKPDIIKDATRRIASFPSEDATEPSRLRVDVKAVQGSITSKLDQFPDGYFDCVLCFLTLCSVEDQAVAVQEMKRLVRPNGGTFGYVEHVAVDPDEPYRLLELQQTVLDPLQQIVADNCHLHRYTEQTISDVFLQGDGRGKTANSSAAYANGKRHPILFHIARCSILNYMFKQ